MQTRAVEITSTALTQYNLERDIAMFIKKEFDRIYGTTWHCVVGKKWVRAASVSERLRAIASVYKPIWSSDSVASEEELGCWVVIAKGAAPSKWSKGVYAAEACERSELPWCVCRGERMIRVRTITWFLELGAGTGDEDDRRREGCEEGPESEIMS
jgi:hypothetical protein